MGVFSEIDLDQQLLKAVFDAMEEPALTPELDMEIRVDAIVRQLDELCRFASNPETVDLVQGQRAGIGQIITRAQLVGSFLMAREQKPGLRVVQNNG